MSTVPSPSSTSHPKFASLINAALESYRRKTKKDLASHPLLPILQSCNSPEAILAALKKNIPAFSESQNGDDRLTKWVTPTVNVLYSFSATLGGIVGLAFPPANLIFTGIGVLLLAVNGASAKQGKLINLFDRIEHFFCRLEIYTNVTLTTAMTDTITDVMVEVLSILAIATKDVKRGRLKKYTKMMIAIFTRNTDIEDSLHRLDELTQEEARMALAELLKVTHSVDDKVIIIDDRVKSVEGNVQDVHSDVLDIGNKVQGVDDRMKEMGSDVKDISSEVGLVRVIDEKLDQANRNKLCDNLSRWLSPPEPSTNHNIATKAHHDGTAQWFFQGSIFSEWKSSGSFLWIHGKPGAGKSVICSSIIEDIMALRKAGKASIAFFYFDFRDVHKQKLCSLLSSLLIQLSSQSDSRCDILSRLYFSHDRARKPSDRAMIECLKEMLSVEAQGPTYIIMDALDECPIATTIPTPREEVLELVAELVDLRLPNVRICVTSRPEHDIQAVLKGLTLHPVSLHDESGQQQDIADYVTFLVRTDQMMRRWREDDKELVIKTLSEKSDGMFRWVFCQLELLRRCFPPSVRHTLEELPESLDDTYERILREIKKPNRIHAHRLLQCLVAAVYPLHVKELAEVLAVDFDAEGIPKLNPDWRWQDEEEAVISACSSLVMIVNDKDKKDSQIVQFSHFSVKEFLTANRLAEPIRDVSYYHIRLEEAHTVIAQACLGTLLRLPVDDSPDCNSLETFPMASYAVHHLLRHAEFGNTLSRIMGGMECLFDADKPHFATWFRANNEYLKRITGILLNHSGLPLFYAAMFGFCDLAQHLIARHPEHMNVMEDGGMYPIHIAASRGHPKMLSLLLAHGADVDLRSSDRSTPLHYTLNQGHLEAGQFLLDHGADIDARFSYHGEEEDKTALYYVVSRGNIEYTRMLLKSGAAVDTVHSAGDTLLHVATRAFIISPDVPQQSLLQVTQLLLEHGVDVNARNSKGEAPLHTAALGTNVEVAQLLLENGADVHARNFAGRTACQEASLLCPAPYLPLIELLRRYGDTSL